MAATGAAYYEDRRETIVDCLLATAVLLAICLVVLMLTLVTLGIHYEVHTFGFDEPTSDFPVLVVRRDLGERIKAALPNTEFLTRPTTTPSTAPSTWTTTTVTPTTTTTSTSTTTSPTSSTTTCTTTSTRSSPTSSTTSSTRSSTTRTTTTTTKEPRKLVLDGVLLCTLRASLSIRAFVYPDDGVCAITMFNSLFVTGGSTLTPPYNSDLRAFLGHRQAPQ
ncbi:hypothetical protein MTO96_020305 [Rhipicephalus appendiculatus]